MRAASPPSIVGGRSIRLDVLRAIAALMVIGFHSGGLVGGGAQGNGLLWLPYNLDTGVELFFVLSGYLIALPFLRSLVNGSPAPDTVSYTRRRAARILPGYWLALCIATFLAARQPGLLPPLGMVLPQVVLIQGVVPGDGGLGPLVVGWTLSVEAAFYVGIPIATWALLKHRTTWSVRTLVTMTCAAWAVSAAIGCCVATFIPTSPLSTLALRGPAGLMCQFCPGILVALIQVGSERAGSAVARRSQIAWILIGGGLIGWVLVVATTGSAPSPLAVVMRNQVCGLLFGLILLGTLEMRGAVSRFTRGVALIGTVSYGLYLWHWLALEVVGSTGFRVGLPAPLVVDWALAVAVLTIASLPLAILSWHLVEKRAISWASDRSVHRRLATRTAVSVSPRIAS
jgi:peptidoglycan/LPS O-acetylase OafA/YrhL